MTLLIERMLILEVENNPTLTKVDVELIIALQDVLLYWEDPHNIRLRIGLLKAWVIYLQLAILKADREEMTLLEMATIIDGEPYEHNGTIVQSAMSIIEHVSSTSKRGDIIDHLLKDDSFKMLTTNMLHMWWSIDIGIPGIIKLQEPYKVLRTFRARNAGTHIYSWRAEEDIIFLIDMIDSYEIRPVSNEQVYQILQREYVLLDARGACDEEK